MAISSALNFKFDTSSNPSTNRATNATVIRHHKSCQTKTFELNQPKSDPIARSAPRSDPNSEETATLESNDPIHHATTPETVNRFFERQSQQQCEWEIGLLNQTTGLI